MWQLEAREADRAGSPPAWTPAQDLALRRSAPVGTNAVSEPALNGALFTVELFSTSGEIHSLFLGAFHVEKQKPFPSPSECE